MAHWSKRKRWLVGIGTLGLLAAGGAAMVLAAVTGDTWLILVGAPPIIAVYVITETFQPSPRASTGEDRVARLLSALRESTAVIREIETEVAARSELAKRLEQDVARQRELLAIDREQAEALAQTLRLELRAEGRRGFVMNIAVNVLFFGLGVVVTLVVH